MHPSKDVIISRPSSAALSPSQPFNPFQGHTADDLSITHGLLKTAKQHIRVMTSFTDTSFDRHDLDGFQDPSDSPDDNYNSRRRKAIRSSMTWNSSIGDPQTHDQDDLEDRTSYAIKYNILAKKHGVRELMPENYGPQSSDPTNTYEKPGSWFSRKILRRTSSTQSVKPDKPLKHKRSFSDLSLRLKLKKHGLQDKDLQELVRICGSTLLYLPTEYATGSLSVPTCFRATAQYLVQHAPSTRGVFRIPGSHSVVAALYNHYCDMSSDGHLVAGTVRCPTLPEHIKCDVHDVASAFKRFLSGVPGGILGSLNLFDSLVSIQSQLQGIPELTRTKQSRVRARLIALSVSSLRSRYRRDLICAVFGLLCMIGRAAEIARREDEKGRPLPTSDLMGYGPLGIVFGPLIVGNLLDNYTMHLANPREGLILLPASSPKSKKDKTKGKASKGKIDTIDEGATFIRQVDKIKVANGIAEMLITHWRDVVRHLKSFSTSNVVDHKTLGGPSKTVPYLRPSASESFALRKPPDWDGNKAQMRDIDLSPTPVRHSMGLKGSYSQYFVAPDDNLKVRKQRVRPRLSSSKLLAASALKTILSPTLEERGLEKSPTGTSFNVSSTCTSKVSLGSARKTLACSALDTDLSPRTRRSSMMQSSNRSSLGPNSQLSSATAVNTAISLASGKSSQVDTLQNSLPGFAGKATAVSAYKAAVSPAEKLLLSTSLTSNAEKKTALSSPYPFSLPPPRQPESVSLSKVPATARLSADVPQPQLSTPQKAFGKVCLTMPTSPLKGKTSSHIMQEKHSLAREDWSFSWSKDVLSYLNVASEDAVHLNGPPHTKANRYHRGESQTQQAQQQCNFYPDSSHKLEAQSAFWSPSRLSLPKPPARRSCPPVAGRLDLGAVRRISASEPEVREPRLDTSPTIPKVDLDNIRRRKAFTNPAQFSTRVDLLTKVSDKEDRASLLALSHVLQSSGPEHVEDATELIAGTYVDHKSNNIDIFHTATDDFASSFNCSGEPTEALTSACIPDATTTGREQLLDGDTSTVLTREKQNTRFHPTSSIPSVLATGLVATPRTSQKIRPSNVFPSTSRSVGNVRALAAKFDAAKPTSPAYPSQFTLPISPNQYVGRQAHSPNRRESILAPYTTNPPSPSRSQRSARIERTPVKSNAATRAPTVASNLTPRQGLENSSGQNLSNHDSRKSRQHTMTPSRIAPRHSPVVAGSKLQGRNLFTATVVTSDRSPAHSKSTNTSEVLQQISSQHGNNSLSSVCWSQLLETSEVAQDITPFQSRYSNALSWPSDTLRQRSDASEAVLSNHRLSLSGKTSQLYGQIRQLQRQLKRLEDENLELKQQLEDREGHDMEKLKKMLREITNSCHHWKVRAEGAEKELEIINRLASRHASLQITRNPLASKGQNAYLTHENHGTKPDNETSTPSFHGLDGAGSRSRSAESNGTVIRDLREAAAGLDCSIWLDRTVFYADVVVPNRLEL